MCITVQEFEMSTSCSLYHTYQYSNLVSKLVYLFNGCLLPRQIQKKYFIVLSNVSLIAYLEVEGSHTILTFYPAIEILYGTIETLYPVIAS